MNAQIGVLHRLAMQGGYHYLLFIINEKWGKVNDEVRVRGKQKKRTKFKSMRLSTCQGAIHNLA